MADEHTPAPWAIVEKALGIYKITGRQGPIEVCPAIAHGLADARLIAAAPLMLAALVKLVEPYQAHSDDEVLRFRDTSQIEGFYQGVVDARAAIAAARGHE